MNLQDINTLGKKIAIAVLVFLIPLLLFVVGLKFVRHFF